MNYGDVKKRVWGVLRVQKVIENGRTEILEEYLPNPE
jgi:hypothetical protein